MIENKQLLKNMGLVNVDELLVMLGRQCSTKNSKYVTVHSLKKRGLPQERRYSGKPYWSKKEIRAWERKQLQEK